MSATGMPSVMHHQLDACGRRLHDGVAGERRRHEDHGGVAAGLAARVGDRIEDRNALDHVAALARRDSGHHLGAVLAAAEGVELAFLAGDPLHHQPGVVGNPDRMSAPPTAATALAAASAIPRWGR